MANKLVTMKEAGKLLKRSSPANSWLVQAITKEGHLIVRSACFPALGDINTAPWKFESVDRKWRVGDTVAPFHMAHFFASLTKY